MNNIKINDNFLNKNQTISKVCDFLRLENPKLESGTLVDAIKCICVERLCKAVGITGTYNYKSEFFDFFASIMGEALCEKLNTNIHVACEELRLIKYEHINLVAEVKSYLENETTEEAFLDAFELADRFKYLIPKLKKV